MDRFGVKGVAVGLVPWATWAAHLASSLHLVLPAGRPTKHTILLIKFCFQLIWCVLPGRVKRGVGEGGSLSTELVLEL